MAGVYAVVGWLVIQLGIALETSLNLPGWFDTLLTTLVLIGIPIAIILAWAFEMTPEGVKRTEAVAGGESIAEKTGRKLDFMIIGGLALVAALVIWQTTKTPNSVQSPIASEQAAPERVSVDPVEAESEDNTQSIAVLPFDDFSPNKDQDYFARGISEELLNVLAKTKGLRVSSRTSAFAFKDQGTPIAQIAKELDVGHILEGSVRKSGETLRITAQLIDTGSDVHLWSETYDRPLTIDNIFDIQDEITAAIVKALKGQLTITPDASNRPVSLEAFELYIKARENLNTRAPEPMMAAVVGFRQVIDLDPNFAPAYSGLADTLLLMPFYSGLDRKEANAKAAPMVARALALAPDTAETLASAALLEINLEPPDYNKAEALARRAVAANPNYAIAHHRLAITLEIQARYEEAFTVLQTARKLDPFSAVILSNIVDRHLNFNENDAARSVSEELVRLHPDHPFGYQNLSRLALLEGNYAQAHILAQDTYALSPNIGEEAILNVYYDAGLYDHALHYADDPTAKAYLAVLQGDHNRARQYMSQLPEVAQGFLQYFMRDFSSAQPKIMNALQQRSLLEGPITNETSANYLSSFAHISRETGEPYAQYTKKLATFYGEVPPADISDGEALLNRAKFEILKGDPEKSYTWIDRFQALGLVNDAFSKPIFDDIRNSPEFQKRVTINETLRAGYRKQIEDQLANPKPNWKLPKE